MSDEEDRIARYQRPPRKGQFKPGQSAIHAAALRPRFRSSRAAKRERFPGLRRSRPRTGTRRGRRWSALVRARWSSRGICPVTAELQPDGDREQRPLHNRNSGPIPPDAVPVIEAVNVSKGFGATTALVDVSLKAYAGRILALLGDNGAGKSTLIKILSGVFQPDRGELRFRGKSVVFGNPAEARQRGIATVFQDLAICELLSVTRNIVLGREPQKGIGPLKWLDVKKADELARSALHRLGVRWERGLDERGVNISGGERQSLAIAPRNVFWLLPIGSRRADLGARRAPGRPSSRSYRPGPRLRTGGHSHDAQFFVMRFPVADDLTVLAQGRVAAHFRRDEIELDELTDLVARLA